MKVVKKILQVLGITLLTILALILLVFGSLHVAKFFIYPDYYSFRTNASSIPGLGDGFVPQGLGYDRASDTYLHSGYNGEFVEYYLVNGKETKRLSPIYAGESTPAKGHGGGIAVAGDYVYAVDNPDEGDGTFGALHIYRLADLLTAKDGGTVKAIEDLPVDNSASFCFADGKYLYVGEFYRADSYETVQEHRFTTPIGDQNNALMTAYALNADGTLVDQAPDFAVTLTDRVQGFAITKDNKIALSRSWGMGNSTLSIYNGWADFGQTVTVGGEDIPLYHLDSSTLVKEVTMPVFSEGLALLDDENIVISFESACNKYIIGKFFFANKVVSYPLQ